MVIGRNFYPAIFPDEAGLELLEPTVSTSIGCTEGFCGSEGYTGPLSPLVHVSHITGEKDFRLGLGCLHTGVQKVFVEGKNYRESDYKLQGKA